MDSEHFDNTDGKYDLTDSELAVLGLLVKGHSKTEIADILERSYGTIDTHFKNIYKKLEVNSAVQAVVKAIQEKIV